MTDYKELVENLQEMTERGTGCEFDVMMLNCVEKAANAIEHLVKERDAVIADAAVMERCKVCKHYKDDYLCRMKCRFGNMWEWRGVIDEID